jgi:hypothetical protein
MSWLNVIVERGRQSSSTVHRHAVFSLLGGFDADRCDLTEGYKLSSMLGPLAFPFCCVLSPKNSAQLMLLGRLDGAVSVDKFSSWLRSILDAHDMRLAQNLANTFEQECVIVIVGFLTSLLVESVKLCTHCD